MIFFHKLHLSLLLLLGATSTKSEVVGFLFALEKDEAALREKGAASGASATIAGRSFQRYRIGTHTVVSARMGSGTVETALTAQTLLVRFRCDFVVSAGPAGALNPNLPIGTWYAVSEMTPWQKATARPTGLEFGKDVIWLDPQLGKLLPKPLDTLGQLTEIRVASGEMFVASDAKRLEIRHQTGADAIEMNLFGLWSATKAHKVPLLTLRVISDHAGDQADSEFKKFNETYSGEGGKALVEILEKLPPDPNSPTSYKNIREASGAASEQP